LRGVGFERGIATAQFALNRVVATTRVRRVEVLDDPDRRRRQKHDGAEAAVLISGEVPLDERWRHPRRPDGRRGQRG